MMKKIAFMLCGILVLLGLLPGCAKAPQKTKIGVSIGAGSAVRWEQEKVYMEQRARELDADIEVRLNKSGSEKSEYQDCMELIDSDIDVLIMSPKNLDKTKEVIEYARDKKVKVINYARIIKGEPVDVLVGYDSQKIGQIMGQYITEMVFNGNYIILRGDSSDNNANMLNEGAMRYIDPIRNDINVILEAEVKGWLPENAKVMVRQAIESNGKKIDAIFAPNDKIAAACREALVELNITTPVVITGMDTELDAVRRIVKGEQSMTIYMDLKELAFAAIDQAVIMAKGDNLEINSEFDNGSGSPIKAKFITGRLITKENIDRILIESGYYTREQVYE